MQQNQAICTIVAKNYVSSARALSSSIKQVHPELKFYVLVIDDFKTWIEPQDENYNLIDLNELEISDVERLSFKYDVVEFATAVKPRFLRHLLQKYSHSKLVYLDPDIFVFNRLDEVFDKLDSCNALLTPHSIEEYPRDSLLPNLETILRYGLYNLGFIALKNSPESLNLLRWWEEILYENCVRDGSSIHYVDQKVMDLSPLFFHGIEVEKGAGYNVAYWNLHERRIFEVAGKWVCNEVPLCFFHFSSFDPSENVLTRKLTRATLTSTEILSKLCNLYRETLLDFDYDKTRQWPYQHATFDCGESIDYLTRRSYRNSRKLQLDHPHPFGSQTMIALNKRKRLRRQIGDFILRR